MDTCVLGVCSKLYARIKIVDLLLELMDVFYLLDDKDVIHIPDLYPLGVRGQDHQGAMYIRINDPSLNRKTAKYPLSHIRDEVLLNTPDLQLK